MHSVLKARLFRRANPCFKSAHLFYLFACLSLGLMVPVSNAQTLEDVCFGDIELTEYTASIVNGGAVIHADFYSVSEQSEIATVLADASLSSATAAERVRAVLQACTDGQILQARTSAALGQ